MRQLSLVRKGSLASGDFSDDSPIFIPIATAMVDQPEKWPVMRDRPSDIRALARDSDVLDVGWAGKKASGERKTGPYDMERHQLEDFSITLNQEGSREFCKVSYPIRYGRFSEIQTPQHTFQFNLNGELKHIQGRGADWPHPAEWLKRTVGND